MWVDDDQWGKFDFKTKACYSYNSHRFTQVKKMLPIIIGALVGGVGGYFFYRYVGCKSGACMITGNPYLSTLYGMLLGGLVGNILK